MVRMEFPSKFLGVEGQRENIVRKIGLLESIFIYFINIFILHPAIKFQQIMIALCLNDHVIPIH